MSYDGGHDACQNNDNNSRKGPGSASEEEVLEISKDNSQCGSRLSSRVRAAVVLGPRGGKQSQGLLRNLFQTSRKDRPPVILFSLFRHVMSAVLTFSFRQCSLAMKSLW